MSSINVIFCFLMPFVLFWLIFTFSRSLSSLMPKMNWSLRMSSMCSKPTLGKAICMILLPKFDTLSFSSWNLNRRSYNVKKFVPKFILIILIIFLCCLWVNELFFKLVKSVFFLFELFHITDFFVRCFA